MGVSRMQEAQVERLLKKIDVVGLGYGLHDLTLYRYIQITINKSFAASWLVPLFATWRFCSG
jgi:hypothetical protein